MSPIRVEQLRDRFERWRENRVENADQKLDTQPPSPAQEKAQQRAGPELEADAQIERGRQAFRERYEAYQRERAPAVPEPKPEPKQEQAVEKKQEQEIKIDRGFGISR